MKRLTIQTAVFSLMLVLTSCITQNITEPTVDVVATEVERLMTEAAIATEQRSTEALLPSPTVTEVTAEETPMPTETATETATPTPDLADPVQRLGDPAFTDNFTSDESPWDYDSQEATFKPVDGKLTISARTLANYHTWQVANPLLLNAYVEAAITIPNCAGRDRFGLAVRSTTDGQQFYFLMITCDGQWGFYRMAEDVTIIEIKRYQPASQISDRLPGSLRVGIWMEGSNFIFYIDGEEIGTATDTALTEAGYTGFLIAYASTPGFTVQVDQLQAWQIP